MWKSAITKTALCLPFLAGLCSAQPSAKVDFARDVLPILRQNCVSCHGPAEQTNGLRLDRKSSAMKFGTRRVVPGSSQNSLLYHRLIGTEYGMQMPPTGALPPEQIQIIKTWIEEGADWPDSLANEVDLPPLNPKAVRLVATLRKGDLQSFVKTATAERELINARGPGGATPFMYAVLYADTATVAKLLKLGADPNKRNDGNATALMWAGGDLEKTRLLLEHGADVNARSDELRTPLMVAARRPGAYAAVRLLLERGANPNPNAKPFSESSPLIEAATAGESSVMELLLEHGADAKAGAQPAVTMAVTNGCSKCLDLLVARKLDPEAYTRALADVAVLADVNAVRLMLNRGANINTFDPLGRTPLMYAVASDALPLDVVKLLIERGADVNAKSRHKLSGDAGLSILDIAKLHGETPIVEWLVKAGAKGTERDSPLLKPVRENSVRAAIERSVPLVQRSDSSFSAKAGCVSCHNNSLQAMAVSASRKAGFRVDETVAAQQVKANIAVLEKTRERLHQGFFFPVGDMFGPFIVGYILTGLSAEHYEGDLNTDAVALYLRTHQAEDGSWPYPQGDSRPPLCSDHIGQTTLSMRALQLYAPKIGKADWDRSIQRAAAWLVKAQAKNNDDRGWRLLGLAWAGIDKNATQQALRELLAQQRTDGGWSDIPSTQSTAYATGQALFALHTAGLRSSDPAYERGVQFLLKTQQEDGSWYVKTRALGFQPYFDAGFPYGFDQWISAAGTSWATMALATASPKPEPLAKSSRAGVSVVRKHRTGPRGHASLSSSAVTR
jgi:ankyrin repeat protein